MTPTQYDIRSTMYIPCTYMYYTMYIPFSLRLISLSFFLRCFSSSFSFFNVARFSISVMYALLVMTPPKGLNQLTGFFDNATGVVKN